jgi:3-oxosteroid 1-dehydrogenase
MGARTTIQHRQTTRQKPPKIRNRAAAIDHATRVIYRVCCLAGSANPRSNSMRELAAELGIDSDRLAATVDRFNAFARVGVDGDFHRGEKRWRLASASGGAKNPSLGTIEKPPFYGVQVLPSIGNSTGLLANRYGQVMHHRGRPIEGLYVSGVAAARTEMGAGYQAGMNLASAMTFSYLAVEHMARKATTIHLPSSALRQSQ